MCICIERGLGGVRRTCGLSGHTNMTQGEMLQYSGFRDLGLRMQEPKTARTIESQTKKKNEKSVESGTTFTMKIV